MADIAQVGIKNSWSLLAYARMKGKMQVGNFSTADETTGEVRNFKSCIFTDTEGNRCFVGFSSKLGELSPAQISAEKENLQVVELESGSHILCRKGESSWEDVNL